MMEKQDRRVKIRRSEDYEKGVVFGKIQQTLNEIERKLQANCLAHTKILKILQGDDRQGGLCTQVAINTRSIKWIWSLISALALGLIGLFVKVIIND